MIYTLTLFLKNYFFKIINFFLDNLVSLEMREAISNIQFSEYIPEIRFGLISIFIGISILVSKLIFTKTNNKQYLYTSIFFWTIYIGSLTSLLYNQLLLSYSTYIIGILISLLIIFKKIKFDTFLIGISFWLLYAFTIISVYMTILSINNYYINYYREGPKGDKGEKGGKGDSGKDSIDYKDEKLCVIQIEHYINKLFLNWKQNNGIEGAHSINNLYIKDHIKKICNSNNFKKNMYNIGVVRSINNLKQKFRNWIFFILEYENGQNFLENHFLIDKHWKNLLSQTDKYSYSPFVKISKDPIWNWGSCIRIQSKNIKSKNNIRNKCKK